MNAYEIVGYTGDAEMLCPACAVEKWGPQVEQDDPDARVEDSEGNEVQPVFASDCDEREVCSCGREIWEGDEDEDESGPWGVEEQEEMLKDAEPDLRSLLREMGLNYWASRVERDEEGWPRMILTDEYGGQSSIRIEINEDCDQAAPFDAHLITEGCRTLSAYRISTDDVANQIDRWATEGGWHRENLADFDRRTLSSLVPGLRSALAGLGFTVHSPESIGGGNVALFVTHDCGFHFVVEGDQDERGAFATGANSASGHYIDGAWGLHNVEQMTDWMTRIWRDYQRKDYVAVEAKAYPAPTVKPTVETILADPCASNWIKMALRSALDRDVVDAANDAQVLLDVLKARC